MVHQLDLEKENRALREELQRAQEKLFQLDQLKLNFVALTAAELRNPLAVMLGYANRLQEQSHNGTRESSAVIVSQAAHLKRIIDSIVLLQQVESQQLRVSSHSLTLAPLAQAAIRAQEYDIAQKSLSIENHIADDCTVIADRELVSIILANLLANAIKFSPHDKTIVFSAETPDDFAVISITDQGIGILPEEMPYIFERFYQAGDPFKRRYGGIGLGLAIAKTLIELQGGRIWVESALNKGSTFRFTLPHAS